MRLSIPVSAFVAAIVGFGGTLAIIIAAADAVGATQIQTASWVTAICLAMAVESLWLSWRTKMPVISACAWATCLSSRTSSSSRAFCVRVRSCWARSRQAWARSRRRRCSTTSS